MSERGLPPGTSLSLGKFGFAGNPLKRPETLGDFGPPAGHQATPYSDVSPSHGGDVSDPESGEVSPPVEPSQDHLAAIIADLNTRFGGDLDGGDQVILENVLDGMAEDDKLVQEAR